MDNQGIQGLNNVIVWIESEFPECYQQMWKKCILQTEWKSVLTTLMIHLLKDKTLWNSGCRFKQVLESFHIAYRTVKMIFFRLVFAC